MRMFVYHIIDNLLVLKMIWLELILKQQDIPLIYVIGSWNSGNFKDFSQQVLFF